MKTMTYTQDAEMIQRVINARQISYLCHFTTLRNAVQIFKCGHFLSRQTLERLATTVDYQDDSRYEGKQYVNLSIQEPNQKLWGAFIRRNPSKRWCVFCLKPRVCLYQGVKFTTSNATANNVRYHGTGEGVAGFEALFADRVVDTKGVTVRDATLPPEFPTSEQAEVLVPEPIPVNEVLGVIVRNEKEKAWLLEYASIAEQLIIVDDRIFNTLLRCA